MNIAPLLVTNPSPYKTEKKIFTFISTISSIKLIKTLSSDCKLTSGLKQIHAKASAEFTPEKYQSIVFPKLGISIYTSKEEIESKQAVAIQYAHILKQYQPDESFDYLEIARLVKKVFKKHISFCKNLLHTGIAINIGNHLYFAKVQTGKIRMITESGTLIEKGSTGTVQSVYEIASRQFLALKQINTLNFELFKCIQIEIDNLSKIHEVLSLNQADKKGFQDPILADFNLPSHNLIGYLSPRYEINLLEWVLGGKGSPNERIKLCKSIMEVCMHIQNLGFWHGDIKLDNIMLKDNQPILIDWAGFLPFEEAATKFISPKFQTPNYLSKIDYLHLESMQEDKDAQQKSEFIKAAKSLELFSIGVVIYAVLTSEMPFNESLDPDLGFIIPKTHEGIKTASLMTYGPDILFIMNRMLAHLPEDRYSYDEAYKVWQSINTETFKLNKKVYKLS